MFWYQTFDSLDILISAEVSLILKKLSFIKKTDMEEGFVLMNLSTYYIEWLRNNNQKEKTHPLCLHTKEKDVKVEGIDTQNDYETTSTKWTDKKKTDLFFAFCKCVWIPRKQVQDCSKEFLGNKNNIDKKIFLGKATGHNDHYMINMGCQKPKIGANWPLTGHYLQRWFW